MEHWECIAGLWVNFLVCKTGITVYLPCSLSKCIKTPGQELTVFGEMEAGEMQVLGLVFSPTLDSSAPCCLPSLSLDCW